MKRLLFFFLTTGVSLLTFSQSKYKGVIYVTGGVPEFEFNLNMEAFCSKDSIQNAGKDIAIDVSSMVFEELKKESLTNCTFLKGESALDALPRPHKAPKWKAMTIAPSDFFIFGKKMKIACNVGCNVGLSFPFPIYEKNSTVNKTIFPGGIDYAIIIWPYLWDADLGGGGDPLSGVKSSFLGVIYGFYDAKTGELIFKDLCKKEKLKVKGNIYDELLGNVALKVKNDFMDKIASK
jgi:hypothetical protein